MHMARNRKVMGRFTVSGAWMVLGWLATALMALAAVAMVVTALTGGG
jgi:Mn2+/Fe2+ NRAMP family transporter